MRVRERFAVHGASAQAAVFNSEGGFTLLEVLASLALLGIALTVILQLFSANLRGIEASDDYIHAVVQAQVRMREILEEEDLTERTWEETTDEGYRLLAQIIQTEKERTENLPVDLLEIKLTVRWSKGSKQRQVLLKTMKVVKKEV